MIEIQNHKVSKEHIRSGLRPLLRFWTFEHLLFGFVSDFGFRASDLRSFNRKSQHALRRLFTLFAGI
jgi:hypothetical protein